MLPGSYLLSDNTGLAAGYAANYAANQAAFHPQMPFTSLAYSKNLGYQDDPDAVEDSTMTSDAIVRLKAMPTLRNLMSVQPAH
jgi:hypothetical protein